MSVRCQISDDGLILGFGYYSVFRFYKLLQIKVLAVTLKDQTVATR